MKNWELFEKDPRSATLTNNGQARISHGNTAEEKQQAEEELKEELRNFVCEGQYAEGFQRIMDSFLMHIGATNQPAAWVSGFYGSGKSHMLKMLGHLWVDTSFADGSTARGLVPALPDDIRAQLKELDTQARRTGGAHAALGVLPSGEGGSVRLNLLGILFRSQGLPEQYRLAKFVLYLKNNGIYESVRSAVEAEGRNFERELVDLAVSPVIHQALLAANPQFGTEEKVQDLILTEFEQPEDISTSEFTRMAREALAKEGEMPLTIVILDEVQIFIRNDERRTQEVVEVAEALSKEMDSRVLVVGAGQSALGSEVPEFQWLRDRFTIKVELSDADVENVTRKVLLKKKPEKLGDLNKMLERHSGEIQRQLSGTQISSRAEDRDYLTDDYPVLPVRRRFWELVSRAVDPTGTSSMLRTQLQMVHEGLSKYAKNEVGTVIPGDFMFEQLQAAMVQHGVLLNELNNRIRKLDDGTETGKLASRLASLIFLIRKLPREKGVDAGILATPEILADLLVSDLDADGSKLRQRIPELLEQLAEDGVLLKDEDEYNLQTRESLEWEQEYRIRMTGLESKLGEVHRKQEAFLRVAVQDVVKKVSIQHGEAKVPRKLAFHFGQDAPSADSEDIPAWVRDGWDTTQEKVIAAARAEGSDSPMLFIFIPRHHADEFRRQIVREHAAQATLDFKGSPTTNEGEEARSAMETRRAEAQRKREELVREITAEALVFKGGGSEVIELDLHGKLKEGAEDALVRLFPEFDVADHKGWATVINRAKNGDDSPLSVLQWNDATEKHPVAREIIRAIGNGKIGRDLRKEFGAAPYGWPQDAIDGILIALHASGHVIALADNKALPAGHLGQNNLSKAEFRLETVTLSPTERVTLRGLFQKAGIKAGSKDNLEEKSEGYLSALATLASRAGGEAPLPAKPDTSLLDELNRKTGNERLAAILTAKDQLETSFKAWDKAAKLTEKRLPKWQQLQELLIVGSGVAGLEEVKKSMRGIEEGRMLLDKTDHVPPLLKKAADKLRQAVVQAHDAFAKEQKKQMAELEASSIWGKLDSTKQASLLRAAGIGETPEIAVGTEEDLVRTLRSTPVTSWDDKQAALERRFQKAMTAAAQELAPKAKRVTLPSGTISNEAEMKEWLAETQGLIENGLKEGPVIL